MYKRQLHQEDGNANPEGTVKVIIAYAEEYKTIMAYLTTRPIDELYPLSVNFFPHPLLSTIPAKSAPSGEMR